MGIITDYVVADVEEAQQVLATISPTKRWIGVDAKTIDNLKLAKLGLILDGTPVTMQSVREYDGNINELASRGEDGPWVLLVPSQLTAKLAALREQELSNIATQWYAQEEFKLDRWERDDVASLLKELHELARTAVRSNKPMLLFISL